MHSALTMNYAASRPCRDGRAAQGIATRAPRLQRLLIRVFDDLATWQERAAQRRRLLAMDDRMLHDIGIDSASAMSEGTKPFWRD